MVSISFQIDRNLNVYQISGKDFLGLTVSDASRADSKEQTEAFTRALHPDDKILLVQMIASADAPQDTVEANHIRLRDAGGTYRILIATVHPGDERFPVSTKRLEVADPRKTDSPRYELPEAMIRTIMVTTDDYVFFKDTHHTLLAGSQPMAELCRSYGIEQWEQFAGKTDYEVFPEQLADLYYALEIKVYTSKEMAREVQPYERRDGQKGWVDNRKYPIVDENGGLLGLYGLARDITKEIEAQQRQALVTSVFAHAAESIVILNRNYEVVDANKSFENFTGLTKDRVLGQPLRAVKHTNDKSAQFKKLWSKLVRDGSCAGEVTTLDAQGRERTELCRITAVLGEEGEIQHFVGLYSDITPQKRHEQELETIANFDALTGLVNRSLFEDRLSQALASSERQGKFLALAYIDLDGFKLINDSFGHAVGDEYLVAIAKNMNSALRDTDTLARIGGDEFIALLNDLNDPDDYKPGVERLLKASEKSVVINGRTLPVSASIGIARYPLDGLESGALVRCADQAMYEAKQQGKDRFYVFDRGLLRSTEARDDLRNAIAHKQFELLYQPKVDLRSGEIIGVESLARWNHPTQGILGPAEFLPLINRENLQIAFGTWVIDHALEQMSQWAREGLAVNISANIAGVHLLQSDFVQSLVAKIREKSLIADNVFEIEILETSALNDVDRVAQVIREANQEGISFALDDFGTGYSSLTHLRRLPVSTVKIDTSFVLDMLDSPEDTAIVSSMVSLCRGLGRQVIAEGVSSLAHAKALMLMDCHYAQGFGISKPLPANELADWATMWRENGIWRDLQDTPASPSDSSIIPLMRPKQSH
ncbi:putative bifunctional diguanylate cyclase/phosphodiesterase [Congregibacter sp.]|uniref:putative bifunctional diguanylate cyclase/phosphodiesterase n=1 Tax=Congregibacter sp. TaxID=2744308 RepID=UPI00385D1EAE